VSQGRFTFRLQRLLALRQMAERAAMTALASAESAANQAQAARQWIAARRAKARAALSTPIGMDRRIAELRNAAFLVEQLDAHVEHADRAMTAANEQVRASRVRLAERVRERRILERLRDRQVAEWSLAVEREERAIMDAIARPPAHAPDGTSTSNRP
jgi:flagellar FliJ protein